MGYSQLQEKPPRVYTPFPLGEGLQNVLDG